MVVFAGYVRRSIFSVLNYSSRVFYPRRSVAAWSEFQTRESSELFVLQNSEAGLEDRVSAL
ncbi:hypothetical protein C0J52_08016 [Blattella germanica]|nr:hypothetical protein C0J52_08016 [Blattella germanica]